MGRARESEQESQMAEVVARNIRALLARRRGEEQQLPVQTRLADRVTSFTGSLKFVYIHLALFGCWVLVNLPWAPNTIRFDPTFVVLAMFASVEAIFLSTFVLITQNRMAAAADKRADLDLQISLLAEHEVTRLITLVKAIAQKLEVEESQNPELAELEQDVKPEKVLDKIEESEKEHAAEERRRS